MAFKPMMRFYTESQLAHLKEKIFELLEKRGVKMNHKKVMTLLHDAGAKVDFDGELVHFPRAFLGRTD